MRADLARFYHRDLLACTAPELMAYVPDLLTLDSSTARALNEGPVWQTEHFLLADLWGAMAGRKYPHRPTRKGLHHRESDPAFLAAREAARERSRTRRARIAAGDIQ